MGEAEILLFHLAQGLTPGVIEFADKLRKAGNIVHTPDLFEGRTFNSIEDGVRIHILSVKVTLTQLGKLWKLLNMQNCSFIMEINTTLLTVLFLPLMQLRPVFYWNGYWNS